MNKYLKILIIVGCLIPLKVMATTSTINLSCPSSANPNSNINCQISASTSGGTMNGIKANYQFNNASFVGFTPQGGFNAYSNSGSGFALGNTDGVSANTIIGTLTVHVGEGSSSLVSLINFDISDIEGKSYSFNTISTSIRLKSTNNNLANLSISNANIGFNPNTTNYNTTIDANSIYISATKSDGYASISGDIGSHSLNYGNNSFHIYVTAENNNVKTYTINVNRPDNRSSNNNLNSLSLSNMNIGFNGGTNYRLIVENNIDNTNVAASASDGNSSISGLGAHQLNVGSNTIQVTVTAQNGSKKTYTIVIIRKNENGGLDALSDNNYLASLIIDNYTIPFDKTINSYNLTVDNNIDKVNINYAVEDITAVATIDGDTSLVVGLNTIKINVTSASNKVNTYTISILRKSDRAETSYTPDEIVNLLATENEIYVLVNSEEQSIKVDTKVIETLKIFNKIINYEIRNNEDKILYNIKITSDLVKYLDNELNIKINTDNQDSNYLKKYKKNNLLFINYNDNIELENSITYKINVGDKYKNGDTLYLYNNDTSNNNLILNKGNLTVQDGYVTIKLDKLTNYVLSDKLLENNDNNNIIIIIETIIIVLGIVLFIFTNHNKKLKNNNSIVNKDITKKSK